MKARRSELGVSQEEFASRSATATQGGISVKVVQRIEAGTVRPRATTLGALDRAAGWPSGRARAILEGDEVTLAQTSKAALAEPNPSEYDDVRDYLMDVYWYLRRRGLSAEGVQRIFRHVEEVYESRATERSESDPLREADGPTG